MKERCPGTGRRFLPVYDHLPNGRPIKRLIGCADCGRMSLIDARRPWMAFHKREIGQTFETYWAKLREANKRTA